MKKIGIIMLLLVGFLISPLGAVNINHEVFDFSGITTIDSREEVTEIATSDDGETLAVYSVDPFISTGLGSINYVNCFNSWLMDFMPNLKNISEVTPGNFAGFI